MIQKFRASIIGLEKLIEVNKIFFSNSGDIVKPRFGKPFVVKHFIFGQGVFKTALITSDGHGFDGIYHGSLVEVIGNIYENPELLEDV